MKPFWNFFFLYAFLATVGLFVWSNVCAQTQTSKPPSIYVKARVQKDRVLLRWAVDQPNAWALANKYGFSVERYTVLRNGHAYAGHDKVVLAQNGMQQRVKGDFGKDTVMRILLTPTPLKPRPQPEWKDIATRNDEAAIIAQGLYGEGFEVSGGNGNDIGRMMNLATEQEQRFLFSLMAADRNFEAAQMAGWGLIDSTTKPNEKYLYRIYAAVPATRMKIDTGGVFIGTADHYVLPTPKDPDGRFGDKSVLLSWNYKILKDEYTSYFIERSDDGKNFSRLSDLPVMNMNENDDRVPTRMYYTDSLPQNNKKYYYRVVGITCFGETSPPSQVIEGAGHEMLAYVPNIRAADIADSKTATLHWEFAGEGTKLLDRFELQMGSKAEGPFKIVIAKIDPAKRSVTYNKLNATNYFVVAAVDKQGNRTESFPYLVQPIDSIPPAVPQGLRATVDSLGKVTLRWSANKEEDLAGYVVMKGNKKGEELKVMNAEPFISTEFKDSVNLQMLNSKVYYAVMALDKRYNQSRPCAPIELIKPDKIPPVSPVFRSYVVDSGKVKLVWINSTSDDVASHKLYRKTVGDTINQWILVKEFTGTITTTYVDDKVENGSTAAYTIVAIDNNKNESQPAPSLTVRVADASKVQGVKNLRATAQHSTNNILVEWNIDRKDIAEYQIYRTKGAEPTSLWKVIKGDNTAVEDKEVKAGNTYQYGIRATLKDGRMSGLKEVSVAY
jgi:fibronectin type 3 domain-containing protein